MIAVFVVTFLVQAFTIPSESMEKTLLIGDYLLVDKFCYGDSGFWNHVLPYRKIRRGDIVVFHYPVNPAQHFVKRVVGVPGDRVRLMRTDAPAFGVTARWWQQMRNLVEDKQLIIPEDSYFVMGDNRDDSQDSRYWGFVPRENIIGRPLLIYWSASNLNNDLPGSPSAGDRLYHLAYAVTHVFQITRWERTFRLVR